MRSTTLFALLTVGARLVVAQNLTFIEGLINQLTALNLTRLVGATASVANTSGGDYLFGVLSSGQPLTLLAPNNDAWAGVKPLFANDPTWVAQTLAYHLLPGNITLASIASLPNESVFPTFLKDPSLVHLLGGRAQSIGFTKHRHRYIVTNQDKWPPVIVRTVTYQNILIHLVTSVADLPPQTKDALALPLFPWTANLTTLVHALPPAIAQRIYDTPSITFFAPTNKAFQDAIDNHRISPAINGTDLDNLILNHVVNGSLIFTGHPQTNYTSAAGETITVGTGGPFGNVVYYKGTVVADIIQPDIITQNGVVHIINNVLSETSSNDEAASSAYSLATLTATATLPAGSPERRRRGSRFRF